jgi:exosome complex component RRP4
MCCIKQKGELKMGEILVKPKQIAVPGELLAKGMDCFPSFGTYRDGENIHASRLGLIGIDGKVIKIIPLTGVYIPKKGDVIIGRVIDLTLNGWRLDISSPYSAMLMLKDGTRDFVARNTDLNKYYSIGDYLMVSVINVSSQKLIDLSMKGPGLRKLVGGRIINVNCNKVPRVIGKQGSMVSMVKNATNCKILVGQNGLIWIEGSPKDEVIAVEAIKMIEQKSHVSGLTDMVKAFLEKVTGKKIEDIPQAFASSPEQEQKKIDSPSPDEGNIKR